MKDIKSQSITVDMLTVRSYEMNVYLVELRVDEIKGLVYEGDSPMRFYSSQHIRDVFDGLKIIITFCVANDISVSKQTLW